MIVHILDENNVIKYLDDNSIYLRVVECNNTVKKEKWNSVILKNLIRLETFERMCG